MTQPQAIGDPQPVEVEGERTSLPVDRSCYRCHQDFAEGDVVQFVVVGVRGRSVAYLIAQHEDQWRCDSDERLRVEAEGV